MSSLFSSGMFPSPVCVWGGEERDGRLFPLLLGPCRRTPLEEHCGPGTIPCLLLLREEEGLLRGEWLEERAAYTAQTSAGSAWALGLSSLREKIPQLEGPGIGESPCPHVQGTGSGYHMRGGCPDHLPDSCTHLRCPPILPTFLWAFATSVSSNHKVNSKGQGM